MLNKNPWLSTDSTYYHLAAPRCTNVQPWEVCTDPESKSWKSIVSESITEFSVNLYTKLRGTHHSQNLLISPISVAGLLSHLLLGKKQQFKRVSQLTS